MPPVTLAFFLSASVLAVVMALPAAPAAAEPWDCRFAVACHAAAGCADSSLTARVIAADHAGDLFLSSALGNSSVSRLTPRGNLPASYAGLNGDGTTDLLTITTDRLALLTRHGARDEPGSIGAVTYFGTCEAMT